MKWGFQLNAIVQPKSPFYHPFCHLFSLRSWKILERWLLKTSDTLLKLLYAVREIHLHTCIKQNKWQKMLILFVLNLDFTNFTNSVCTN